MLKRAILNIVLIASILLGVFVVTPPVPAQADTSVYNHIIPFTITDTSGVARTNVPVIITYDVNGKLVAHGLTNATATDTYVDSSGASNSPVGSGTAYSYMMATSNITAVIPSLPAFGSVTLNLYTGYSPSQTAFPIIPGNSGKITVTDAAILEPSSNFRIEMANTWIDTTAGASKNLVSHYDATNGGLQWFVSPTVSGNVTGRIVTVAASSIDLLPNATGSYTNIEGADPVVAHYLNVDDPVATPDNIATYVYTNSVAQVKDAYNLSTPTFLGYIQSNFVVSVYFRHYEFGGTGKVQPFLRLGASETAGTLIDSGGAWATNSEVLARPGGGTWTAADFADLQVGIGLQNNIATESCTQVYVHITYSYETWVDVTAMGVTSAEHDVNLGLATPFLKMSVDTPLILPVSSNLVMNIPLPEESCEGASFTSVDSNAYSLTVSGATYSPGVGRVFDGLNDFIYSSAAAIDFTAGDFTINLWLYIPTGAPGDRTIMSRGVDTTDGYFLYYSGTSRLQFYTCQAAAQQNTQSLTIDSFDMWHYYSIVRSGAVVTIYRDGVDYTFSHGAHVNPLTSARDLYLGRKDTVGQYMSMTLGDVEVYSIAFTPTQIIQNYQATLCTYNGSITEDIISTMTAVPNSTSDWTISQNDATTYIGSYKHYVGGTLQAWYEPTDIISGTILPDRATTGGTNNGAISWGINTGITITGGDIMTSASATSLGTTSVMMQASLDFIGTYTTVYLSFQYGLSTTYGYWTSETSAIIASPFSVSLTGLTPNTTYHYRAIARIGVVYSYGADITFTTSVSSSSQGSTTPIIKTVKMFSGYKTTGDWLLAAELILTYPPYYPSDIPSKYFHLQLLGTDHTTILGASPITQWGDRPASIYLAPSANITNLSPYIVKIASVSSANITISCNYTLQASDWQGNDLTNFDEWCKGTAVNMQYTDGTILTNPYVVTITDYGNVISDYAGGYFTSGIPNITDVRPNIFQTAEHKETITSMSSGVNYNAGSTLTSRIGVSIVNDATTVGAIIGLNAQQLLLFAIFGIVILCIGFTVSSTNGFGALGALCLTVPIIGASLYFNILAIGMIVIFAFIMVFLFVRQFFIKTL